jgi:invasion protein IalB
MAKNKVNSGKKIDPKVIFDYAEANREAAQLLMPQARKIPSGVNTHADQASPFSPMLVLGRV